MQTVNNNLVMISIVRSNTLVSKILTPNIFLECVFVNVNQIIETMKLKSQNGSGIQVITRHQNKHACIRGPNTLTVQMYKIINYITKG